MGQGELQSGRLAVNFLDKEAVTICRIMASVKPGTTGLGSSVSRSGRRLTASGGTPVAHHAQRLTIGAVPGSVARRTFGAAHQPKKILRFRGSHLRFEHPPLLPDSSAALPRHIPKQGRLLSGGDDGARTRDLWLDKPSL